MSFSDCEGLILPRLYNWGRKQNRTWKLFKKKHTTIQMTGSSQNPRTMILSPAGLQRVPVPQSPEQAGTLFEGFLPQWICTRSMHLRKDADCFVDFVNGLTTNCSERIADKLTRRLVSTNSFSKYLNLASFYLNICFPDVAPRKRFQTDRLTSCWPTSTSEDSFSALTFLACLYLFSLVFVFSQPNRHYPSCCDNKGL